MLSRTCKQKTEEDCWVHGLVFLRFPFKDRQDNLHEGKFKYCIFLKKHVSKGGGGSSNATELFLFHKDALNEELVKN